jgi:hypothetical protein
MSVLASNEDKECDRALLGPRDTLLHRVTALALRYRRASIICRNRGELKASATYQECAMSLAATIEEWESGDDERG